MWTLYIISIVVQIFLFKEIRHRRENYFDEKSGLTTFASFLLVVQIIFTIVMSIIYLP